MTTLMTDMFQEIYIKNMMIKSHNYNNFLTTVLFIKMSTLVNTIAKFTNTCYILSTIICMIRIISLII